MLLNVSIVALLASGGTAAASCSITGTIIFSTDCDANYGPNGTASTSGAKLTIDGETFDDPTDGAGSFSRVVLKAGSETSSAINIGVDVKGVTVVDSHNSVGVYLLTKKGNITVDIGEDVLVKARQSGIFAKADNSGAVAGGTVIVTNYGTIDAGYATGDFGAEGIRVRALQGAGTVYNYGEVSSNTGRGIRIDGGSVSGVSDALVVNTGSVEGYLDGVHINGNAGSATIQNGVDGTITSLSQRGAVASSSNSSASLLNDGEIISDLAAGALVWGATDATATNGGTVTAAARDNDDGNDYLNFGVQVWSRTEGTARLANYGDIVAHDGWGAWMLSNNGSIDFYNSGTLHGKSTALYVGGDKAAEQWVENPALADYAGAYGGDITFSNDGLITADDVTDFTNGMALVTFGGSGLGTVSITNESLGIIGAGYAEGIDLSLPAVVGKTDAELQDLAAAAANAAISLGVEADSTIIINRGTLLGRVAINSPSAAFDSGGPTGNDAGSLFNSGVWVTSGTSGFSAAAPGTIHNSGALFALGEAKLTGAFENSGAILVTPLGNTAAQLTIDGDYAASGDARLFFDITNDAGHLVSLTGAVAGQTKVYLNNLLNLDWKADGQKDLIDATPGAPELGADAFVLAGVDALRGLVSYRLAYDEDAVLWSLDASLSEQSVGELADLAETMTTDFTALTSDLLYRTDELRDAMAGSEPVEPLGYAPSPATAAETAIADLTPADRPMLRAWSRSQAAVNDSADFAGQTASAIFGLDVTNMRRDERIAAGVFGALTGANLDYTGSSSGADLTGRAFGVYGTVACDSGLFSSAVLAVESSDIDLALSGESASFGAWTTGGRLEVGYAMQVGDLAVEPSVGIRFGTAGYDSFFMSDTLVSFDNSVNSAVEARMRVSRTFAFDDMDVTPFAVLTVGQGQSTSGTLTLSDLGAAGIADAGGAYGTLALGVEASTADGALSAFARGDLTVTEHANWSALKLGGTYRF